MRYLEVMDETDRRGIRKREHGRFIRTGQELLDCITNLSRGLWGCMVDHMTVYSKDNVRFTLTDGMEITGGASPSGGAPFCPQEAAG